jgi:chaperonin GroES
MITEANRCALAAAVNRSSFFAKYAGTEVKLDGEDYLVIRESDLLAIVTNGSK